MSTLVTGFKGVTASPALIFVCWLPDSSRPADMARQVIWLSSPQLAVATMRERQLLGNCRGTVVAVFQRTSFREEVGMRC